MRSKLASNLARRGLLAAVAAIWLAALAITAALRSDVTVVLLVSVLGLQLLVVLNSHRQNRFVIGELRQLAGRHQEGAQHATDLLTAMRTMSSTLDAAATAIDRGPENTRRKVIRDTTTVYRQLEALVNLYSMVPVTARVPAMRGWAASPDLLLLLVETIRADRPRLSVECGSGVSTLWCALARRAFGVEGRHVALEHDAQYVRQTEALLEAHGVADFADVRLAPLQTYRLGDQDRSWYAKDAWRDLDQLDLLFVDGPPGVTGRHARYPALPLLADRFAGDAVVVLDDLVRTDEQELVARWLAEYPWLTETRLNVEKIASVLRCSR
ncbi:class I SAM-dependent methyltransferase [Tenggerimyces flavus]|uniref:Class I SAM-dependent methyltransferase n=1 Tax=Tenggerimyces flavus TaxID=1708749 RepID=A0ABV7YIT7_9ACTN|nr:class I SAM-dependent methyltransferase [Tenggerimyces flavus]MBM7789832.1 putative O-methyltransferase YrrM [Tenggerimyces flavus]